MDDHGGGALADGLFERLPDAGLGQLGLPFWLFRVDYMHGATVRSQRYDCLKPLKKKPSDYMRENVYVTTSGMAWAPAIQFCQSVLGMDRVLYAMDYTYQYNVEEVVASDALAIADADKKKFFQTNAETLFRLA